MNEEDQDFYLNPPIVDELLSLKELSNIESWKKTQRELFEKELVRYKELESEKLEKSYTEKKKSMEEKLNNQLKKCTALWEELQY